MAAMGRGSRPKVRWARDRQRRKKERDKAKIGAPAAEKAKPPRRRAAAKKS
jgi:hypothetical protein